MSDTLTEREKRWLETAIRRRRYYDSGIRESLSVDMLETLKFLDHHFAHFQSNTNEDVRRLFAALEHIDTKRIYSDAEFRRFLKQKVYRVGRATETGSRYTYVPRNSSSGDSLMTFMYAASDIYYINYTNTQLREIDSSDIKSHIPSSRIVFVYDTSIEQSKFIEPALKEQSDDSDSTDERDPEERDDSGASQESIIGSLINWLSVSLRSDTDE